MTTGRSSHWTIAACAALLSVTLVWHARATSSRPPAQPTAIATVDIVDIINGLEERTVLEDQLNARRETRQGQVNEVLEGLKALQADIEMLSAGTDEHREKLREYLEQQAVADARAKALSRIISIDMGNVMGGLYGKVEDAIQRIADREGYDLVIMDDSKFPLPENAPDNEVYRSIITKGVVYRHESVDITQQVITLMNNEFSAP